MLQMNYRVCSLKKYFLEEHDEVLEVVNDPKRTIKAYLMFNAIASVDALGWIHHFGYYSTHLIFIMIYYTKKRIQE